MPGDAVEERCTLGEIRNLLAGLRCDRLPRLEELPDTHPVDVTTAVKSTDEGWIYAVCVDVSKGETP